MGNARTHGPHQFAMIDPPWPFQVWNVAKCDRHVSEHYETMSFDEIAALPVGELLARDAVIGLWVTCPTLLFEDTPNLAPGVHRILKAWGFRFRGVLFAWVKTNKTNGEPWLGMGFHTRGNLELCLRATRGKGLKAQSRAIPQLIMSPRREHSRKPDEAYQRVERLYGTDISRVDCFSRERRAGWAQAYSNQGSMFNGLWLPEEVSA